MSGLRFFYTSKFPRHADYLELCYKKGLYTFRVDHPLNYSGNYLSLATILFLFTYALQSKLNGGANFFSFNLDLVLITPSETVLDIFPPLFKDLAPAATSVITQLRLLQEKISSSILEREDHQVMYIMLSYQEELAWFEIHSSVRSGRRTVGFKETPSVKLYYLEPFVSTPPFVHGGGCSVLVYTSLHTLSPALLHTTNHFFVTFINTVRWCNYRVRPKRETWDVSRSKCANLITACILVS